MTCYHHLASPVCLEQHNEKVVLFSGAGAEQGARERPRNGRTCVLRQIVHDVKSRDFHCRLQYI